MDLTGVTTRGKINILADKREIYFAKEKELIKKFSIDKLKADIEEKKNQLNVMETQLEKELEPLHVEIKILQNEIIDETVKQGESVKGESLQCVYRQGALKFDSASFIDEQPKLIKDFKKPIQVDIARLKKELPEIHKAYLERGKPSASLQTIKQSLKSL